MCLSTITEHLTKPDKRIRRGYKIVSVEPSGYGVWAWNVAVRYETDKWTKAERQIIQKADGETYVSGFHIFPSFIAAWRYRKAHIYDSRFRAKIVEVMYTDVETIGSQNGVPCVVAQSIKFLSSPRSRSTHVFRRPKARRFKKPKGAKACG